MGRTRRSRSNVTRRNHRSSRTRRGGYNQRLPRPPMLLRDISVDEWADAIREFQQVNGQNIYFFKQSGNWSYAIARANNNQYRCLIYLNGQLVSDRNSNEFVHL
jgi:hypothetical protein